jgi:hypothetical protein
MSLLLLGIPAAPVTLTNSASTSTSGTTVTTGNSGGGADSAFDIVRIDAGSAITYDNGLPHTPPLAFKFATGVTANTVYVGWSTSTGGQATKWFRMYVQLTATPVADTSILQIFQGGFGGSYVGAVQIAAVGTHLKFQTSSFSQVAVGTSVVPIGTTFRVEGKIVGASGTGGSVELKLFNSPDSVTPTETTSASGFNTIGAADTWAWGSPAGDKASFTLYLDDLGLTDVGYLGPVPVGAFATPARLTAPRPVRPAIRRQPCMSVRTGMKPGAVAAPVVTAMTIRARAARVLRQPVMTLRPGISPPPGTVQQVTMTRRPRLVPPRRGAVTGPLAPGAISVITPIRPVVLATPRRGPPRSCSRVATGLLPGTGLSGIPVVLTRSRPAVLQRQPRQAIRAGMAPGTGLSGIPVQLTRCKPARVQYQPRMRAVPGVYLAPGFFPALDELTRQRAEPARLVRRAAGTLRAGMTPGLGLSGIPVRFTLSRPAVIQHQPRMLARAGMLPGLGLSGIPGHFTRSRAGAVQRQLRQQVKTGMAPGLGLSGIPPAGALRPRLPRPPLVARSRVVPPPYLLPPGTYAPVSAPTRFVRTAYRLVRQPPQRVTGGMLPGHGLSGIPPSGLARTRPGPSGPVRCRSRIVAGFPGALTVPVPVPVALRHRQRIRPVASRLVTGILPPSGYPVVAAPARITRELSRIVRQPGQRLTAGQRGSLTTPVPVPVAVHGRQRIRNVTSRLTPPPYVPAGVIYQPVTAPARFARTAYRLVRQPPQRVITGMIAGRGLSGLPPTSFLRSRPARVQRQPRALVTAGQRGSLGSPVPVPVVLRHRQKARAAASRLVAGLVTARVPVPVVMTVRQRVRAVPSRVILPHWVIPPVLYAPVTAPTRIIREPSHLVRQPRMWTRTGTLPGFTPGNTGTGAWTVQPAPPRWRPVPAPARWKAQQAPPRWAAAPARSRWTTVPAAPRWRIIMTNFQPIAAVSLEEVNVNWASGLAGTAIDPTGQTAGQPVLPVQMAFPASSGSAPAPAQPVTWFTASWLTGDTSAGYIAQCLVGPGGGAVTLTAGLSYDVWSKVTGTPEVPAKYAGTIAVY